MDDPGLAWPFWKFGLKKEDLSGKLHDQYNTFPSSILDPEAFHHDVFELSHEADTEDEFYRLLADRKQQRLRELNESLESAAFEIIGNPDLIGTEQWQYALQLFRTKSLDSLVRYFASYLPSGFSWPPSSDDELDSPPGSISDVGSSVGSIAHSQDSIFCGDKRPIMTDEPLEYSTSTGDSHMPLSPRSMTMCSVSSAPSPMDIPDDKYDVDNLTPARTMSTMSFSEPESDHEALLDSRSDVHHEDISRPETPATSVSEVSEPEDGTFGDVEPGVVIVHKTFELEVVYDDKYEADEADDVEHDSQREGIMNDAAEDDLDSETPTPRPDPPATSFFDTKLSLPRRQHRSVSPSRPHPLSQEHQHQHPHHLRDHLDYRTALRSARSRRRDSSPAQERRQSPGGHSTRAARIRKPLPGPTRLSRPRAARHADC